MPRREIGATRWLESVRPDADGRGVVIAVLDTGVDPGAAGLAMCPDGRPKVIDVIDATGSGDVALSKAEVVIVSGDGDGETTPTKIKGASGRTLTLNPSWDNPSNEWRVGSFRLFAFLPGGVVARLKSARRKRWAEVQARALASAAAALAALDALPASQKQRRKSELEARLQALKDADKTVGDSDPGPIVDAVAWRDSQGNWRAAFDTTDAYDEWGVKAAPSSSSVARSPSPSSAAAKHPPPQGALALFEPLARFGLERRYGTFSAERDACNFAVQFYDEGQVLSVVVDAGAHGTHVAGISAAFFEDDPSSCGVAPGAQIVSVKIGDTRQGSMETGTAMARAVKAVLETGCDLVNLSYGEPTAVAGQNAGAVVELLSRLPLAHGVTFVSSAGNAGPALTTVGAPGGTAGDAIIGVGAYVSTALAAAGHSARVPPSERGPGAPSPSPSPLPPLPPRSPTPAGAAGDDDDSAAAAPSAPLAPLSYGLQYNWSSRGPTADGGIGVSISAPGGAVAPVPSNTLQKKQLMNGTSMASPCACGALALVASAVKLDALALAVGKNLIPASALEDDATKEALLRSLRVSPSRLRRAAENTAAPLGGDSPDAVLTYGRGLVQVPEAYAYLRREQDEAGLGPALFFDPRRARQEAQGDADGGPQPLLPGGATLAAQLLPLPQDVRYEVSVSGGAGGPPSAAAAASADTSRGIYLREPHEAAAPRAFTVNLKPTLHADALPASKLAVEDRLVLRSTAEWVEHPDLALVPYGGRGVEVRVDASRLPAGLHYAELLAFAEGQEWRGPLARVPVTVIRPEALRPTPVSGVAGGAGSAAAGGEGGGPQGVAVAAGGDDGAGAAGSLFLLDGNNNPNPTPHGHHHQGHYSSSPAPHTFAWHGVATAAGQELRRFVVVPGGATWCELSVRAGKFDTPRLFLLRASQLAPSVRPGDTEWRTAVTLSPGSEWSASFPVVDGGGGGATLELTVAQFWSSAGHASLDALELSFHGVGLGGAGEGDGDANGGSGASSGGALVLSAGAAPTRALLSSPLRRQKVRPEAKLTALQIPLRPQAGAAVEPLPDLSRDALPPPDDKAPVYRLALDYKFTASEPGSYTPRFPLANRRIYDGELLAQMSWLRDANGKEAAVNDAYPKSARLAKGGEYTLRLHLRHPSLALLESLKGAPLLLERSLDPPVSVPVYGSFRAALAAAGGGGNGCNGNGGGGIIRDEFLNAGDQLPIFLGPVGLQGDDKALPKDAAGKVLRGHLSAGLLRKAGNGGHAPARFELIYNAPPAANAADKKKENGDGGNNNKKKRSAAERVAAALRAARLQAMADLRSGGPPFAEGAAQEWEALGREVEASLAGLSGADAAAQRLPLLLEKLRAAVAGFPPPTTAGDAGETAAATPAAASPTAADPARVEAAADAVVAAIDQTTLAAFMALRAPDEDDDEEEEKAAAEGAAGEAAAAAAPAAADDDTTAATSESAAEAYKTEKKRQDDAKAALLEALKAKLSSALDELEREVGGGGDGGGEDDEDPLARPPADAERAAAASQRARQALAQLRRWVDTSSSSEYQMLHARAAWCVQGSPGLALKALEKLASGSNDDGKPARRDACELRIKVLRSMGPEWAHVLKLEEGLMRVRFPSPKSGPMA
jgi:tripeptidyl-peptidase-2